MSSLRRVLSGCFGSCGEGSSDMKALHACQPAIRLQLCITPQILNLLLDKVFAHGIQRTRNTWTEQVLTLLLRGCSHDSSRGMTTLYSSTLLWHRRDTPGMAIPLSRLGARQAACSVTHVIPGLFTMWCACCWQPCRPFAATLLHRAK